MTIVEMLAQSGVLTVLGIAVVFSFLAIMVFCVYIMGLFFQARGASAAKMQQPGAPEKTIANADATGAIAAISVALHNYAKNS